MRTLGKLWVIAVAMIGGVMLPSGAAAEYYPYCVVAQGGDFGGAYTTCAFTSLEQCRATASGDRSFCQLNPQSRRQADDSGTDGSHQQRAPALRRN